MHYEEDTIRVMKTRLKAKLSQVITIWNDFKNIVNKLIINN
jgi:hypothetical protein